MTNTYSASSFVYSGSGIFQLSCYLIAIMISANGSWLHCGGGQSTKGILILIKKKKKKFQIESFKISLYSNF